ncbi:MAG: amidohydrolase family protein, partial [Oscillospiraceae bacterium]|nr:amidohydrolase family protein [Oscillospiraceae bacterium]
DHAPHTRAEKARPLTDAPSGMIGLETSLAVSLTALYGTKKLTMSALLGKMSAAPSRILRLPYGTLTPGASADLALFDPDEAWTAEPDNFRSKARNTPFAGHALRGRVKLTVLRGKIVFKGV